MSRARNIFEAHPTPKKDPENLLKMKAEMEGNIENIFCSAI